MEGIVFIMKQPDVRITKYLVSGRDLYKGRVFIVFDKDFKLPDEFKNNIEHQIVF